MASRYGSMKQIEGFGPGGETIMDYSIFDAIRSGYGKIVFIVRKEFVENFKAIFEPKLQGRIETDYVCQELNSFVNDFTVPGDRTKPWGTAHAVLCAKNAIDTPFAVINADDFYGHDAFENSVRFLEKKCAENRYAIIGYDLLKTLSDYGTVKRVIVSIDANGNLGSVEERINISMKDNRIVCGDGKEPVNLPLDTKVSMNFWCFHPSFFKYTENMFHKFLKAHGQETKSEFFIPIVADQFIKDGGIIEIIPTTSSWFGVTYKEDAPFVQKSIEDLIADKSYPERLWEVTSNAY